MQHVQRANVLFLLSTCGAVLFGIASLAQGPGGYNPVGPGVDLAGNWGPLFHEDAHERSGNPALFHCTTQVSEITAGKDKDAEGGPINQRT